MSERFDETAQAIKESQKSHDREAKLAQLKDGQVIALRPEDINATQNVRQKIETDDEFYQLVESIREVGILQPIVVTIAEGEILCVTGHRRLAAAQELGLERIRCMVRLFDNLDKKDLAQLVENLNRSALRPMDIAERMLTLKRAGYKQKQLEELFDRNRATVGRYQKMASWPSSIKKTIRDAPEKFNTRVLLSIASKKLTEEQLREEVDALATGKKSEKPKNVKLPSSPKAWKPRIESYFSEKKFSKKERDLVEVVLTDLGLMEG